MNKGKAGYILVVIGGAIICATSVITENIWLLVALTAIAAGILLMSIWDKT